MGMAEGVVMSKTKFTPGPWRYWPCRVDSNAAPPMYDFVQFANQHDHVFRAPLKYLSEADARLIAAAPDMYEELECARDVFRFYQSHHEFKGGTEKAIRNKEIADRIDRLLAKARGEA